MDRGYLFMQSEADRLARLVAPAVEALGCELVWLEYRSGRGSGLLRLYIDGQPKDGQPKDGRNGVTLDDCARVSRQVSALLDVEDPIPGQYTLEVSSPGLDRPLSRAEDFDRFAGETVRIRAGGLAGRRTVTGVLNGLVGDVVELTCDGTPVRVPLADMEMARLKPHLENDRIRR